MSKFLDIYSDMTRDIAPLEWLEEKISHIENELQNLHIFLESIEPEKYKTSWFWYFLQFRPHILSKIQSLFASAYSCIQGESIFDVQEFFIEYDKILPKDEYGETLLKVITIYNSQWAFPEVCKILQENT